MNLQDGFVSDRQAVVVRIALFEKQKRLSRMGEAFMLGLGTLAFTLLDALKRSQNALICVFCVQPCHEQH
ncbi:MAG: hypothetical protein ACRCYD_07060, partial [Plesiomonas sp.]